MKNRYLQAYTAALESIPEKQRLALASLINAHGLHPDDPMIVGVVFTHMLVNRTQAVLTRLESASDPKQIDVGISVLRTFSAISGRFNVVVALCLSLCVSFSALIAYTVHFADGMEEHSRICVGESLFMQDFERYASSHSYATLAQWLNGQSPKGCDNHDHT